MVRNATVEVEKKILKIKVTVQTASGRRHLRTSVGMIGGNPSIKMDIFGGIFQEGENNYMISESLE